MSARAARRLLRRRGTSAGPVAVPAIVNRVLSRTGQPLDAATRAHFEPRFGHDFSKVRIHADAEAGQSAAAVSADAYAYRQDIVFAPNRYAPTTIAGRTLLAHELAHVVQDAGMPTAGPPVATTAPSDAAERAADQAASMALSGGLPTSALPPLTGKPAGGRLHRQFAGCADMLAEPNQSMLSGSLVHRLIGVHFAATAKGAVAVAIPGGSAGPLRSMGLCGGDDKVINPQLVGGMSGAGFPDLARITPGGILQVAEIKPATTECLIDGEEQLMRYIDQGNARDDGQTAWRASRGISVVSPMLPGAYTPPTIALPGFVIRTAWCGPGLMAYNVKRHGRVPVPATRRVGVRERNRERVRIEADPRLVPVVVGAGATAAVVVAGRALWPHFWRVVATRFAIRGTAMLALSAADGPLPVGELLSLGIALVTVAQIASDWNDLWREADAVASREGA
ncbi:hypothetical protein Sa4125_22820 [Aureimonas sp. SA4125]|uniref:eCIS core domain-containing protein n=1 Tax=Aureimonas sp. SA4125 TaxID=2826993 RepID=UPI001CC47EF9|nr:DUF4157 domain-containing protein [Aureimonas sp. SA4125]BDA84740.1 hypothetical protein Sa4125_22820 [Aureimonas sp. SA4125]